MDTIYTEQQILPGEIFVPLIPLYCQLLPQVNIFYFINEITNFQNYRFKINIKTFVSKINYITKYLYLVLKEDFSIIKFELRIVQKEL